MTAIRLYICKDHDEATAMNGRRGERPGRQQAGAGVLR